MLYYNKYATFNTVMMSFIFVMYGTLLIWHPSQIYKLNPQEI